jgi:hypothetical protein
VFENVGSSEESWYFVRVGERDVGFQDCFAYFDVDSVGVGRDEGFSYSYYWAVFALVQV